MTRKRLQRSSRVVKSRFFEAMPETTGEAADHGEKTLERARSQQL